MKSNKIETAIILVSEITKGMKSVGSKALLSISDNLTILDHQIHYIKKYYNPEQIILCTGFDHDSIVRATKKYKNIKYYFNKNYINENQSGSLIECIKNMKIKDALVITNGVMVFNKIKLGDNSSTYFIKNNEDKKNTFDIGTNAISSDGYLFYGLENKWIEILYLNSNDVHVIRSTQEKSRSAQLFLFEFINNLRTNCSRIDFVKIENTNVFKINSIKDISYAKKIYKKYSSVSC